MLLSCLIYNCYANKTIDFSFIFLNGISSGSDLTECIKRNSQTRDRVAIELKLRAHMNELFDIELINHWIVYYMYTQMLYSVS